MYFGWQGATAYSIQVALIDIAFVASAWVKIARRGWMVDVKTQYPLFMCGAVVAGLRRMQDTATAEIATEFSSAIAKCVVHACEGLAVPTSRMSDHGLSVHHLCFQPEACCMRMGRGKGEGQCFSRQVIYQGAAIVPRCLVSLLCSAFGIVVSS